MINTLFYFVDDPTFNYLAAVNNGDISEYTVVFNSADKCIYTKNTAFSKITRVDIANTLGDISDILPVATSSTLGGVKIGYSSDDKRYGLKLDSNNRAYVEVPWTDTVAPAYDDTGILDDLDELRRRIDLYINNLTTTIREYNETLLDDAQWVVENLTAGQVGRLINENIDEYFRQQYGVWDWVDANDHSKGKIIKTSVIEQNVDSIDLRVGSVEDYKDGYLTTALSNLELTVGVDLETGETTAGTNLINSVLQLDADTNNIVKMAASALLLKSSKNGNALNSTADLASVIVNGQFTGYSGLNETVSNQGDAITALSSLMSRVVNSNGTPNSTFKADVVAGLASEVYVNNKVATALSTLQASINGVSSSLTLKVGKDSNGKIESTAVLNADQINLQGQTKFLNAIGNAITAKSLDVIGGGNATISGDVIAKSLIAGPSDAMHIVTTGNEIHFMSGNTIMGKFVTEDNGLQIYVMGPDGNLYKVNFSNWTNTKSSGTSHTYNLYKNQQVAGSTTKYLVVLHTSVYGNGDNTYYSDQSGNNLASLGTSSTTGYYMRKIGSIHMVILPVTSDAASGVTYCIYSVDLYKDTYYSGGTLYDGPNVYGVFKDGVRNDTHYVISSSNIAGVSAYSVYTTESGQNNCSSIQSLNFGSGNVYHATTSYTPTAFGSGHVTRIQGGQYSATLVTY